MLATGAVLAMLGAVLWYARKRGWVSGATGRRTERQLETLERLALGPHHSLHLVRVGEEALVVACSPAGCALLDRVPARSRATIPGVRP